MKGCENMLRCQIFYSDFRFLDSSLGRGRYEVPNQGRVEVVYNLESLDEPK